VKRGAKAKMGDKNFSGSNFIGKVPLSFPIQHFPKIQGTIT
jgi:hypothetical protein